MGTCTALSIHTCASLEVDGWVQKEKENYLLYIAPQHPDVSGQLNNHVRGISVCLGQEDTITSQPEGYSKKNKNN